MNTDIIVVAQLLSLFA